MNLCSIASGSSGNCIYVGNQDTNILIDAGISGKRVVDGLTSIDVNPEKLSAILVTHEHSDHISGIGVLSRKYKTPIYATAETINAILKTKSVGRIPDGLLHMIEPDQPFLIDDIKVEPFSISHDAANPVCYTFEEDGHRIGMATDLGTYNEYIIEKLSGLEALLLEANHDINMLQVGAYPYYLKQRILGNRGHLSNENSGKLISKIMNSNLKHVFLGHLSKENNYAELAYETVKVELEQNTEYSSNPFHLSVANREEPSLFVTVS
ncbi:MBL fold metallo-hydrolase [Anaeromicropila herbilytica]|uniref:MBL fold hydrolase n=1 Tax=Anaeromicropila herbilytica TaxID=2785025 RepID=A0A7R7EKH0_9FIRM|nr:MBL fold metallo-hydrolase [Anaeromicropila herbilytica]BCN30536.1 MBL fold hydrolase [Anaeromicropila herbilytica]